MILGQRVERWISGRLPYRRHRYAVAARLGVDEAYLWPDALTRDQVANASESEIINIYPARRALIAHGLGPGGVPSGRTVRHERSCASRSLPRLRSAGLTALLSNWHMATSWLSFRVSLEGVRVTAGWLAWQAGDKHPSGGV
ncbi:hypothetical protein [Dactylosporangium aurantiacum]|uniref:hypothetical protein n=1 Tax=Dactylosporangium aurantiacum TaxID=35754 RepID=UPI0021B41BCD|nr:hypothetical protein [Dactylosporangium aurantiacum]